MCSYIVTHTINSEFDTIITLLDYRIEISSYLSMINVSKTNNNYVLIDTAFCSGISNYRFLKVPFTKKGNLNIEHYEYITPNEEIICISNKVISNNSDLFNKSIFNEQQKSYFKNYIN